MAHATFVPAGVVLVVDDTEENRYVATRWLTRAGFSVGAAATGSEALRMATSDVDLVVLDVHLPDLHGFEVTRRLKQDPATAHIPVLHLSAAQVTPQDRIMGLEAGADGYLAQPVLPEELVAHVSALLRLSRSERALRQQNLQLEVAACDAVRARAVSERSLALSVALSRARTPTEVATSVVSHGVAMFAAAGVVVVRVSPNDTDLEMLAVDHMPDDIRAAWHRFPRDARVPLADVVRSGEPLFLRSRLDWAAHYPDMQPLLEASGHHANAVLPLIVDGEVLGVLGVAYASDQEFDAEVRALLHSTAQLAALALERARLLEAERCSRDAAEDANRAKSEFLAVMSHELRTPLNAIGGYAELLEMGLRGPVTPEQRTDLERIQRSQRHLLGLINGVLNYARVESGHVHYDMAEVPADELLATCEALTAPQASRRGVTLTFDNCAPNVVARGDSEKIRQVVLNLLSNGVKFTEPGGQVRLTCDTLDGTPPFVAICVSDTGRGIDLPEQERIFQPFVQLDARLTRTQEGTGLGLAISRDLARGMGGDITVQSTPGVGSTFTLLLTQA